MGSLVYFIFSLDYAINHVGKLGFLSCTSVQISGFRKGDAVGRRKKMGRKGKCFGAVKKVFSPESKEKKNKKDKKWGLGRNKDSNPSSSESLESPCLDPAPPRPLPTNPQPHPEEVKLAASENEQSKHADSVAVATESAVASAQAATGVARRTAPPRFAGKSDEEIAAIRIQTAFRGYLARRALRALRGLVRLKLLIHGNSVKQQATSTLRCMQTLARVQSQIRSRRIRMSEENQALQRHLLHKREKELESLRMGDEWDDSVQSKEQIKVSLLSKQEAATRRERALAYAFAHQGKNSSGSENPMFMDPNNPHWGWSWMAARPWERRSTTNKDLNGDRASVKSAAVSVNDGEMAKAYALRDSILDKTSLATQNSKIRPSSLCSPSTPRPKPPVAGARVKSASPRTGRAPGDNDDDARSMLSTNSERPNRRHSIAGSSVGDDGESLASSPAVPSYMAPTQSTRARSRFHSPSGDSIEGLDKVPAGSVKKRLSFPMSPAAGARRHSGPPKVDLATVMDVAVQ